MKNPFNLIHSICYSLIVLLLVTSCNTKSRSTDQSLEKTSALTDLTNFPKEWVLLVNSTPDSISPNHVAPVNTDSTYYGELMIEQKDTAWVMTYRDPYETKIYSIKDCKKVAEAEMVYYNFNLTSNETNLPTTLQVNFRDNAENPQSSVFFFRAEGSSEDEIYELISKTFASQFPKEVQEDYD